MPIVNLRVFITDPSESVPAASVSRIADDLGDLFGSPAGGTWVVVEYVLLEAYAESRGPIDSDLRPCWVEVLHARLPAIPELELQARGIAVCVVRALGRSPDYTHVFLRPEGRGRVAFGGRLMQ